VLAHVIRDHVTRRELQQASGRGQGRDRLRAALKPSRRVLLVGLLALLTLAAARIAAPPGASHYRFSAAMVCGIERWNIKTLKDKPLLRRAAQTTVAHLVSVPRPSSLPPSSRLAFERRIFTVTAAVTLDRTEADLDHHLVLTRG